MKKQKTGDSGGLMYSTNPNFVLPQEDEQVSTPEPSKQLLRISLDRKQRAGKEVTLITGFIGRDEDLQSLGKLLRNKCGTGGSAKEGDILVQGDQRKKVNEVLLSLGYKTKLIA